MSATTGIVMTSTGGLVLSGFGAIKVSISGSACCDPEYIQAKRCADHSLAAMWFELKTNPGDGAGAVVVPLCSGSTTLPLPVYFKLCDPPEGADPDEIYYIAAGNPTSCVPNTGPNAIIVASCCNCDDCDDPPVAFDFELVGLQTYTGVAIKLNIGFDNTATYVKFTTADTGTRNGCLTISKGVMKGVDLGDCRYAEIMPGGSEGGSLHMNTYGTVHLNEGGTYDQGGASDDLLSDEADFALRVSVWRSSGKWFGRVDAGEFNLFYGSVDAPDCGAVATINNDYTEFHIHHVAGTPVDPANGGGTIPNDDADLIIGHGLGGAVLGNIGKGGHIKITPRSTPCDGTDTFTPKYSLVLTGATLKCCNVVLGIPASFKGSQSSPDGFWDNLSIGGNTPSSPLCTVLRYNGGDCVSELIGPEPGDGPEVNLTGTFLEGSACRIELKQESAPQQSIWTSELLEVTCADDLVGGYPRTLVFASNDLTCTSGDLYEGGTATLTLINAP